MFTLDYDMRLRMAVGPQFVVRITTVHHTSEGKVSELLDFYDFSAALLSPAPFLGRLYTKSVNKLFL